MRVFWIFMAAVMLLPYVLAATISGTVYSFNLERVENAIVEINSVPLQRQITENGRYAFTVGDGRYVIRAVSRSGNTTTGAVQETVTVENDGSFTIDLVLFPDISEEEAMLADELALEDEFASSAKNSLLIVWIGIAAAAIGVWLAVRHYFRKKAGIGKQAAAKEIAVPAKEDSLELEVLRFIKSEGNRTTQKDIRRKFPSSEAKISLLLSELEAKGKIEKFKKGRGNIVRLKQP